MKITYNLQVLPQRKNSRKDSEETTALKAFLADSEKKNMVFEYDTPQEAKKRYDSMRNYRNANKLQDIYDMVALGRPDLHCEDQERSREEMSYHTINEEAARRANDMNSFRDYKAGSATAEYRRMVDAATELAERQKQRVDPMYHEKIDRLLEIYCRKLAENMNASYSIEARCPSILISGGGNFPVRKKERQNAARDRNLEEWNYIPGLA